MSESPRRPESRRLLENAARARPTLAAATTDAKNRALSAFASLLSKESGEILKANAADLGQNQVAGPLHDRLRLDPTRLQQMARSIDDIVALPDPVGEVVSTWRRPNGLEISRVRIPLGVLLVVYEARPNVTSDAAALAVKSGNVVILRPGSESLRSGQAIASLMSRALEEAGLPTDAVQIVREPGRAILEELLGAHGEIDLCICRGGKGLMQFAAERARVPVIPHGDAVVHLFADAGTEVAQAVPVIVNAKAQRPSVCNALDCLLVHRDVAEALLAQAGDALAKVGVELRCDPTAFALLRRADVPCVAAQESDFGFEFLDKILAVRVVADLAAAMAHIGRYGTGHTEAILTPSIASARTFESGVTAAAVIVNASTRFNDGGELGLGAEIGISTGRLHAYGPMGLRELCSQKFVVRGRGQVRT